jgi:hypothetical protein
MSYKTAFDRLVTQLYKDYGDQLPQPYRDIIAPYDNAHDIGTVSERKLKADATVVDDVWQNVQNGKRCKVSEVLGDGFFKLKHESGRETVLTEWALAHRYFKVD